MMLRTDSCKLSLILIVLLCLAGCHKEPPKEKEEPEKTAKEADQERPEKEDLSPPEPAKIVGWCLSGDQGAVSQLAEQYAYPAWEPTPGTHCAGSFATEEDARQALQWTTKEAGIDGLDVLGATRLEPGMPIFMGPLWTLFGSGLNGRSTIVRSGDRDAFLAHFEETHEGEPSASPVWVMDARTQSMWQGMAWDAAFMPDDSGVLIGQNRVVKDMAQEDDPVDHTREIEEELGISDTQIELFSFEDAFVGSQHIVQPVLIRYPDEEGGEFTREPLRMAGGGTLGRRGEELLGLHRPRYWEYANDKTPEVWFKLDPDEMQWVQFDEPGGPTETKNAVEVDPTEPPQKGTMVIATRDGSMGLMTVDGEWLVQAVRIPDAEPPGDEDP